MAEKERVVEGKRGKRREKERMERDRDGNRDVKRWIEKTFR